METTWLRAIFYGGKNIENRPWKPWKSVVGHYIALHAGMTYDHDGALWMREEGLYEPPEDDWCPKGCIVGVARVIGCVEENDSPWFFGPFGWVLSEIVPFLSPVKAKGKQGLWPVSEDLKQQVRAAHLAALKSSVKA